MKLFKNISLLVVGIIIGLTLSFSSEIYAATKLVGSKVGKTLAVNLNQKNIGEAVVIGGTSYIPLRVAANELGVEVSSVTSTEINLSSDGGEEEPVVDDTVTDGPKIIDNKPKEVPGYGEEDAKKDKLKQEISEVKYYIGSREKFISGRNELLQAFKSLVEANNSSNNQNKIMYEATLEEITVATQELEKLKTQLADLEAQLAALEE